MRTMAPVGSENQDDPADAAEGLLIEGRVSFAASSLLEFANQLDHAGGEAQEQENDFEEAGAKELVEQVSDDEADERLPTGTRKARL